MHRSRTQSTSRRTSGARRRSRRRTIALLAFAALTALAGASQARADMSPALLQRLSQSGPEERLPVLVKLVDQVDPADYADHPEALLRALRRTAAHSQADVIDLVEESPRRFWLVNAFAVAATPDEVRDLARDPGVETVDLDRSLAIADESPAAPAPTPTAGTGNWGLAAIGAPTAWTSYGVTGAGVRVGSIDTGVDPSNPALAGKVVAWRDFVGGRPDPYDDDGHGTATIGTMVGGSGGGAPIGVAPDATVVVAKAIGANGRGTGSQILAAAQWMTDPDGNPGTLDYPAVVNNSYGSPDANDPWLRPIVRQWVALGILPVFAAGNFGPAPGTVASPASYPESLGVGALREDGGLADFSSRGAVTWENPDGIGPAAGTILAKPELAAPGVDVVTTSGSGILLYSGTSLAAPHVAGAAALVKQANPALRGDEIRRVLQDTAKADTGGGRPVDALAAVAAVLGPAPETTLASTPPDLTRLRTISYRVALAGAQAYRARTDGGAWSAPVSDPALVLTLPDGAHVVEVQAIAPSGILDPTPARHSVTIDSTPPRLALVRRRTGKAVEITARMDDASSGIDRRALSWRVDGRRWRASGSTRIALRPTRHRVQFVARDMAGNVARIDARVVLRGTSGSPATPEVRRGSMARRSPDVLARLILQARRDPPRAARH
jgi:subtilisin family serine protease